MSRRRAVRRRIPARGAFDDLPWMTAISSLTDEEVDELLAGQAPDGHRELAPLADVATALRERAAHEPVPVMRYPLRHALVRGAAPVEPLRPRRLVHAAIGGATIALLGLAGGANALPAPMQDAVAKVGDLVGVEVPHPSDDPTELPGGGGARARATPSGSGEGSDLGTGAPPDSTPGGATPADPGTAGDLEPASPALPADPPVEGGEEHRGAPSASAADGAANGKPNGGLGNDDADDADDPAPDEEDGDDDRASDLIGEPVGRRVAASSG